MKSYSEVLAELNRIAGKAGKVYSVFDDDEKIAPCARVLDGGDGTATLRLMGPILTNLNFSRQDMEEELDGVKNLSAIELVVDSPGGYLDGGISIYQALNARKKDGVEISARIEGLAASAATLPPLAADQRVIEPGSRMMVHRPWTGAMMMAFGNREELLSSVDEYSNQVGEIVKALDSGEEQLRSIMQNRTSMSSSDINAALSGGNSWYNVDEALKAGLVTEIAGEEESDETPDPVLNAFILQELLETA